jgi:phosphatidylserine/phosphatidylglycerophosphate/cardiolipin synthase-like enzyme
MRLTALAALVALAALLVPACKSADRTARVNDTENVDTEPAGADETEAGAAGDAEVTSRLGRLTALVKTVGKLPVVARLRDAALAKAGNAAAAIVDGMSIAQLERMMNILVDRAKGRVPQLSGLTPDKQTALVKQLADSIAAESAHHAEFASWTAVETYLNGQLANGGNDDPVGTRGFLADVERLTKVPFVAYDVGPDTAACRPVDAELKPRDVPLATCVLRNGEASFAARDKLLAGAQKSIWVDSWAIYEDFTGRRYGDKLIALKQANPALDIRVAVDGATADRPTYKAVVDSLAAANIPVVRFRHADDVARRGYGLHRKMLIVDQSAVIIGGMNFGDEYSRINPDSAPVNKWRDTDILVLGQKAAAQAARTYARAWNNFRPGEITDVPAEPDAGGAENLVAFVDHDPSTSVSTVGGKKVTYDPIYLATLRAIKGARRTIDISNAYYIATAPIEDALVDAVQKRHVRLRIHTNSKESVDDPSLVKPILTGLARLKAVDPARVEIYLRQVSTLHSKYLVVDGNFGWVGSYNLHPRSYWYEGETVLAFSGADLGGKVQAMFEQDVSDQAEAKRAADADLVIPAGQQSDLTDLFAAFFFNLL